MVKGKGHVNDWAGDVMWVSEIYGSSGAPPLPGYTHDDEWIDAAKS